MTEIPNTTISRAKRASAGRPNLLFRASDKVYAIEVFSVREIVLLPALKPLAEKSSVLVGLVNIRGVIVPVLDLERRLGRKPRRYSLDNKLLLLQHGERLLAVVVDEVLGVERITADQTQNSAKDSSSAEAIVQGIAKVRNEIAMLLNVEHLFSNLSALIPESDLDEGTHADNLELSTRLFQSLSDEEKTELNHRAESLMQALQGEDAEVKSMAVAEIGQELFAFEFDFVREFFDAQHVTPIPCCPRHIIGNVNLRGNILTLIDIRSVLNLSGVLPGSGGKAVVVKVDDLEVGILVDALHDVVNVRTAEIISPGIAQVDRPVKGTAKYGAKLMSILDLPKLLRLEQWQVNETV